MIKYLSNATPSADIDLVVFIVLKVKVHVI